MLYVLPHCKENLGGFICKIFKLLLLFIKIKINAIINWGYIKYNFLKSLKFSQYSISTIEYIIIMQALALYRQNSVNFLFFPLCLFLGTCVIHIIFNKTQSTG